MARYKFEIRVISSSSKGRSARAHSDVSTGVEYACKKPCDKKSFDRESWEKEIDMMSRIRHVS
ncbi:hypothetical protein K469DRAFT_707085, partial [Zopfia rhizophila CBS 207.26]